MNKLAALCFMLIGGVVALSSANATTQAYDPEKGVDVRTPFKEQRQAVQAAMSDDKTYVELKYEDKKRVLELLEQMGAALEGKGVDELSADQKVQVFNMQEEVNNLLTPAYADSRLVCEHTQKTGSRRRVTTCATVGERRREREQSKDKLENALRRFETKPGG